MVDEMAAREVNTVGGGGGTNGSLFHLGAARCSIAVAAAAPDGASTLGEVLALTTAAGAADSVGE